MRSLCAPEQVRAASCCALRTGCYPFWRLRRLTLCFRRNNCRHDHLSEAEEQARPDLVGRPARLCALLLVDRSHMPLYSEMNVCRVKTGKLERSGSSITEGIGQGRITENFKAGLECSQLPLTCFVYLKGAIIDDALRIEDSVTIRSVREHTCRDCSPRRQVFHLLHNDGLFLGASSAMNVAAAAEVAKKLPPVCLLLYAWKASGPYCLVSRAARWSPSCATEHIDIVHPASSTKPGSRLFLRPFFFYTKN
jgi:hypothetical protein